LNLIAYLLMEKLGCKQMKEFYTGEQVWLTPSKANKNTRVPIPGYLQLLLASRTFDIKNIERKIFR
jgi:hypothetical protein